MSAGGIRCINVECTRTDRGKIGEERYENDGFPAK